MEVLSVLFILGILIAGVWVFLIHVNNDNLIASSNKKRRIRARRIPKRKI